MKLRREKNETEYGKHRKTLEPDSAAAEAEAAAIKLGTVEWS